MKKYTYNENKNSNLLIIYIHGGGYVMGSRDDLPSELEALLKEKASLITVDYPLAPQCKYADIITYLEEKINFFASEYPDKKLILMGRSSGSNSIMSIDPSHLKISPCAIISFYGYSSKDLSWMSDAINGLEFPINHELAINIENDSTPVYNRDLDFSYPYYYSLRKLGRWPSVIDIKQRDLLWNKNIPIFIAHSIFDTDVPFKAAIALRNHFSKSTLFTSQSKKHAFDHDMSELSKLLIDLNLFIENLSC